MIDLTNRLPVAGFGVVVVEMVELGRLGTLKLSSSVFNRLVGLVSSAVDSSLLADLRDLKGVRL